MPDEDAQQPDIYCDSFRFTVTPYGVNLTLALNEPHPESSRPPKTKEVAIIRFSLEQAKVLTMMLRRNLKSFESENHLEIALPAQVYTQLGIAREDWGNV